MLLRVGEGWREDSGELDRCSSCVGGSDLYAPVMFGCG